MAQIQTFNFWVNGKTVTASNIECHINYDNLIDQAVFYYSLKDELLNKLTEGNVTISGQDYNNWSTNQEAYQYVCKQLGLTLIS